MSNIKKPFYLKYLWGFPGSSVVKNLPANAGGTGPIPDPGRFPGEGNDYPFQFSCLGNPWLEELGGLQFTGSQNRWKQLSN